VFGPILLDPRRVMAAFGFCFAACPKAHRAAMHFFINITCLSID